MGVDYVKNLRETDAITGGEVARPSVKRSPEDAARIEATTRAIEKENGRYGRFRDNEGNWATAWQAPGPRTPLVPPNFVHPAVIRRNQTGELMLVPPEGDAMLIEPQQWVVLYEGGDSAIVAADDDFRRVMTREDKVARQAQVVEEEREADAAPDYTYSTAEKEVRANAPAPQSQPYATTISIDGFVMQVLADNARVRQENAFLERQRNDARLEVMKVNQAAGHWEREATNYRDRGRWMWGLIAKAMGYDASDPVGPDDRDIEKFLAEVPKLYAEREKEVLGALHEAAKDAAEKDGRVEPEEPKAPTARETLSTANRKRKVEP